MARRFTIFLLALLTLATSAALSQDADTPEVGRKIARKVTPVYPDLAKRLQISGVVRLRATVAPNGSVKSIEPIGGNPVLIQAAQDAVKDWKYTPAHDETRELIELRFGTR